MKPQFMKGKDGFAFKDGKLYHFDQRHVLVMRGWPEPCAWLKRRSHDWRPNRKFAAEALKHPSFEGPEDFFEYVQQYTPYYMGAEDEDIPHSAKIKLLAVRAAAERSHAAIGEFRKRMPPEVYEELLRYRHRRWHLFCLLPGVRPRLI